jgi:prophage antirepressor-like protein
MEIVKAFSANELHTHITICGTTEHPLFRASDVGEVLEIKNIRTHIQNYTEEEKIFIHTKSNGGMQNVCFLTELGLYRILFKSRTDIAKKFQTWVCNVIKELRMTGIYDLNKKIQEEKEKVEKEKEEILQANKKLQEENKNLMETTRDKRPVIYIYNLDTRQELPELKIGYTTCLYSRTRQYNQTHISGKVELEIELENTTIDIRSVEAFIHLLLSKYKIRSEVFKVSVSTAKLIIVKLFNLLNVINITEELEKEEMLKKMVEYEHKVINKDESLNAIAYEKESVFIEEKPTENEKQTEEINEILETAKEKKKELQTKFDDFINNHCIIHPDVEVSTTDIMGQYRIIHKQASKEVYSGFLEYLNIRFRPSRLRLQNKNSVVNGFIGVKLKNIEYKKEIVASDSQTFIFNACVFSPSGKTLISDLIREYANWKKSLNKVYNNDEELKTELRTYLKNCDYVLYTTIWANNRGDQGYYGLSLKSDVSNHRMTSSTGKRVEKRNAKTDDILQVWETIANAASAENMCAANMSRIIKQKKIFNDDYYYCTTIN